MEKEKSVFHTLNRIDVSKEKKDKQGLSYLPWSKAWELVKMEYPDASYDVERFDNKPWQYDEQLGYMIHTSVTIEGITQKMFLPVMDASNMAMKAVPYTYTTGYGEKKKTKTVEAATMRDISDATMRCLVKNIALFGLGLNFYYGEDISREAIEENSRKQAEAYENSVINYVNSITDENTLNDYAKTLGTYLTNARVKEAFINRKKELEKK